MVGSTLLGDTPTKGFAYFHGCMHPLYIRVSSRVQSQRISLYDFVINNVSLSNDFDDDFEGENFDSFVSMTSIIKAKSTTHCNTLQHTATHCSTTVTQPALALAPSFHFSNLS